jgi:hypothetical protein
MKSVLSRGARTRCPGPSWALSFAVIWALSGIAAEPRAAEVNLKSVAGMSWVPITFRQVSGTRPFIPVFMNEKPFLMMVHSNANFYVQTTHANAASIGLTGRDKKADYGITKDGQVSPLGRTSAPLESLQVGGRESRHVELSIFEIPQNPPTNGMLGSGWLRDQRVIVDFNLGRVGIPGSPAASQEQDKLLLAQGYVAHKMTWDPKRGTWFVMGTVAGHPIRFCVSTVAQNVVDTEWAKANGVELGPVIDQQGGPAGALVDEYIAKQVLNYTVDGQLTAPAQPHAWDLFAYSSRKRDTQTYNEGFLGADFLLANQAVVDFGTDTLFLAKWKEDGK